MTPRPKLSMRAFTPPPPLPACTARGSSGNSASSPGKKKDNEAVELGKHLQERHEGAVLLQQAGHRCPQAQPPRRDLGLVRCSFQFAQICARRPRPPRRHPLARRASASCPAGAFDGHARLGAAVPVPTSDDFFFNVFFFFFGLTVPVVGDSAAPSGSSNAWPVRSTLMRSSRWPSFWAIGTESAGPTGFFGCDDDGARRDYRQVPPPSTMRRRPVPGAPPHRRTRARSGVLTDSFSFFFFSAASLALSTATSSLVFWGAAKKAHRTRTRARVVT